MEKARCHIKKREEFLSYAAQVRRIVGVSERKLTTKELEYINLWQNTYHMDFEMVKAAFELTADRTGKLSFAYMNRILESWAEEGIRKRTDIQKEKPRPKKTAKKSGYDFDGLEKAAFQKMMGGGEDGV